MQNELEATINKFLLKMRETYKNDSFAAGYFSMWIRQLGERDPKLRESIILQLTVTMDNWP